MTRVSAWHLGHRVNRVSAYGLSTNEYRGGKAPMRESVASRFDAMFKVPLNVHAAGGAHDCTSRG